VNRSEDRLDEIDRRLVAILQANGRKPTAAIARELNLSRTAVQARIGRLEKDAVILGYSADLAPHIGGNVGAIVTLKLNIRPCSEVLDLVLRWPEVRCVYSIAGEYDAVLIVSAATTQSLSQLSDRLLAVDGISSAETTMILAEYRG
jgi:Lrp/AsnC family transcriptional regulator, leucine-responsive regulatory protein